MHHRYQDYSDRNKEEHRHQCRPVHDGWGVCVIKCEDLTVIVSVWLSSAMGLIFEELSVEIDPLLEYRARISSAEIVSEGGWTSIWDWSSSGILRSRRWELLLWPTNRRRNAEIAFDERFSPDFNEDNWQERNDSREEKMKRFSYRFDNEIRCRLIG